MHELLRMCFEDTHCKYCASKEPLADFTMLSVATDAYAAGESACTALCRSPMSLVCSASLQDGQHMTGMC